MTSERIIGCQALFYWLLTFVTTFILWQLSGTHTTGPGAGSRLRPSSLQSGVFPDENHAYSDQGDRRDRVRKICADMNMSHVPYTTTKMSFVLADKNHAVIYAEIPKVGSTGWLNLLISLTGKTKVNFTNPALNRFAITDRIFLRKIGLVYLNALSSQNARSLLSRYYKFMFVRHPFTRVLSAYRNKINPGYTYYQHRYGSNILRLFRPKATATAKFHGLGVTFSEFVKYIIYLHRHKGHFDEHWAPFHALTFPCNIHYDFIGKLEHQEQEAREVLLQGFHVNTSVVTFPAETAGHRTKSTATSAETAYEQVSEEDMTLLREVYKWDFLLFDYDPHGFS